MMCIAGGRVSAVRMCVVFACGCAIALGAVYLVTLHSTSSVSSVDDGLEVTLRSYTEHTDSEHVRDQPQESRRRFYATWLASITTALEQNPGSPRAKAARITICSLHNGLGMSDRCESDCLSLAQDAADDAERTKWYTDAAEAALEQAVAHDGHEADVGSPARADGYLSQAIALADAAGPDPSEAMLRNHLRALRLDARVKARFLSDPAGAVVVLRRARALIAGAPVSVAASLDSMFAGTEACASLEADLLVRLGRIDEALQAVDSMALVASPKQPRSFYADRVASEAENAGTGSRVAILRAYCDTRPPDDFTPAARYNLAALLEDGSTVEATEVLQALLANNAASLRAIDDRSRQSGSLGVGKPGWADSASFLFGQAIASSDSAVAITHLQEFAAAFPDDSRAQLATATIARLTH